MHPLHRSLSLLALASGCAGTAHAPTSGIAHEPSTYLVVSMEEGVPTTHLLAADGTVQRSVPSTFLVASSVDVFRVRTTVTEGPLPSCGELGGEEGDPRTEPGHARTVELAFEGMLGERRVVAVAPASTADVTELEQTVTIDGFDGPMLLGHVGVQTFGCGAHGSYDASSFFVDLDEEAVFRGEQYPYPEVDEARAQTAAAQLVSESNGEFTAEDFDVSTLVPTALVPRFDAGRLTFELQLTVDTCYACGDGAWSSYTRSTRLPVAPPRPFALRPAWPASVVEFVRTHPATIGVSSAEASRVERALAR